MKTSTPTTPKARVSTPAVATYRNNPFYIALDGIQRLFTYARTIAIFLLILSVVVTLLGYFQPTNYLEDGTPRDGTAGLNYGTDGSITVADPATLAGAIVGSVLVFLLAVAVSILVKGLMDYAAARAAENKLTTFREAWSAVIKSFWSYAAMNILLWLKLLGWTLLFVLPGVYFAYRYSLSGVAFFAEGKRGNQAIKRSLALTKGAWLTTFASLGILNLLTLSALQLLNDASIAAQLYRNYKATDDAKAVHPSVHWLSIMYIVTIGIILLAVLLFIPVVIAWVVLNR